MHFLDSIVLAFLGVNLKLTLPPSRDQPASFREALRTLNSDWILKILTATLVRWISWPTFCIYHWTAYPCNFYLVFSHRRFWVCLISCQKVTENTVYLTLRGIDVNYHISVESAHAIIETNVWVSTIILHTVHNPFACITLSWSSSFPCENKLKLAVGKKPAQFLVGSYKIFLLRLKQVKPVV